MTTTAWACGLWPQESCWPTWSRALVCPLKSHISVEPESYQDTGFINKDHEEVPCDMLVTGGNCYLPFWSFKRPNKQGMGAQLSDRGHRTGKELASPLGTTARYSCLRKTATTPWPCNMTS